jgi:hypothetical protein
LDHARRLKAAGNLPADFEALAFEAQALEEIVGLEHMAHLVGCDLLAFEIRDDRDARALTLALEFVMPVSVAWSQKSGGRLILDLRARSGVLALLRSLDCPPGDGPASVRPNLMEPDHVAIDDTSQPS